MVRIVIVPGNGGGDVEAANWYGWARDKLNELPDTEAILRNMPDPVLARKSIWIPFMHDELKCDKDTIIIGHSSGAEAAMRYAEIYKVRGIILVSACVSDLGDENERLSGYYEDPWQWDNIRDNTGFVVQFGSEDDPFIPFDSEQQVVADQLQTDLRKYNNKGHFMSMTFPDLLKAVKDIVQQKKE